VCVTRKVSRKEEIKLHLVSELPNTWHLRWSWLRGLLGAAARSARESTKDQQRRRRSSLRGCKAKQFLFRGMPEIDVKSGASSSKTERRLVFG
jgi:hypothetical protein